MINVSDILSDLRAALDAEGSDYYRWEGDFRPAINYAIDYIVTLFNKAFSDNKLTEENLRELIKIEIFRASKNSTLTFTSQELDAVWSIHAIYPNPRYATLTQNPTPITPDATTEGRSVRLLGYKYLGGTDAASKSTVEEWNENEGNPFANGNSVVTSGGLVTYAYLSFSNQDLYEEGNPPAMVTGTEIMIRPDVSNKVVAVAFLNYPTRVVGEGDTIQLPRSVQNLLVNRALMFISFKQGDNTTLYAVSDKDTKELIKALT